jgi:hypothetical protein
MYLHMIKDTRRDPSYGNLKLVLTCFVMENWTIDNPSITSCAKAIKFSDKWMLGAQKCLLVVVKIINIDRYVCANHFEKVTSN